MKVRLKIKIIKNYKVLSLRLIAQVSDKVGKENLKGYIKAVMKESYEYIQKIIKIK